MKGKAVMVRFSAAEIACFEDMLKRWPNVSASTLIRAVVLATPRLAVANALAKHAAGGVAENED